MSQLTLFASGHRQKGARPGPYVPFDAPAARTCILQQLQKSGSAWMRRMALRKATGMHPREVGRVFTELKRAGLIEETDTMDIIHPRFGRMGQTRGYRIAQQNKEAA